MTTVADGVAFRYPVCAGAGSGISLTIRLGAPRPFATVPQSATRRGRGGRELGSGQASRGGGCPGSTLSAGSLERPVARPRRAGTRAASAAATPHMHGSQRPGRESAGASPPPQIAGRCSSARDRVDPRTGKENAVRGRRPCLLSRVACARNKPRRSPSRAASLGFRELCSLPNRRLDPTATAKGSDRLFPHFGEKSGLPSPPDRALRRGRPPGRTSTRPVGSGASAAELGFPSEPVG